MRIARVLVLCLLPSLAATVLRPVSAHAQAIAQVELLHAFRAAPGNPVGGLARAADGSFYGLTARLLYRLATDGTLTVLHDFDASVSGSGAPTVGPDGVVYGTVVQQNRVSVFRFEPATSAFRILHTFDSARDGHMVPDEYGRTRHRLVFGADGLLYGTTGGDFPSATPARHGTVYRVHPGTGAGTTLHEFSGSAPALRNPIGGLVEAGGQLYGVARYGGVAGAVPATEGQGGIFRVDPATGTVTTLHLLSGTTGRNPMVGLTRTSDGWIYGTAFQNVPGGSTTLTHVFRFTPPSGALEIVAEPGVDPSQLIEAGDGHLYGVSEHNPRVFRVRRAGGGHVVETVHQHAAGEGNIAMREQLAVGLDGFLYGTAFAEGPHWVGTVFRFDPLAAGGAGNPSQFATVHSFPQNSHNWLPSVPVRAPNGDLYGTTSRGGLTGSGAVYRVNGVTGAVSIVGQMPGVPPTPQTSLSIANSDLVLGPDGLLYGTSVVNGHRIVRVNPANGAITTAGMAGLVVPFTGLTRGPDGGLYLSTGLNIYRFDTANDSLTSVATVAPNWTASGVAVGADGRFYVTTVRPGVLGSSAPHEIELARVDLASATLVRVAALATFPNTAGVAPAPVIPIAAANGTLLVPVGEPDGAGPPVRVRLLEVTPATGGVRTACASFGLLAVRGGDDTIYAVDGRLRRCDPTTGVTIEQPLPPSIGTARARPAMIAGVLHGATSGGLYGGGTLFRLNPGGPPALDTDGDGLSNLWETTYGLNPLDATGEDGGSGDADGDGQTNVQELADGTHPRGTFTRYFAEGATGSFFRTRIDLGNPNVASAAVLLRFLTDTGAEVSHPVLVAPGSHASVDPATIAGLANVSFSTVLESDVPVIADRTMSWDMTGYGSHRETAVLAPSTSWFFAEGTTTGDSSLFYLLQNPQTSAVTATVRYLRALGLPPIEKTYVLPAHSRTTIPVDTEDPGLGSTDVSAQVTATAPIIAERAMYRNRPGQPFAAGSGSAGVTAPALEWFLAEGATGTFFDLFILIANPNPAPATVEVRYLPVNGQVFPPASYVVPANGRFTIWVDDQQLPAGSGLRPFANSALSAVVRSVNGLPIVVERTMWWPGPETTPDFWYESHNSPGATATALRWGIAGGDVGGPDGAETFVLIANATAATGQVAVRVLLNDGSTTSRTYAIPGQSRTSVVIGADFPAAAAAGLVSVLVESIGTTPVPIAVESASYASPGGVVWARGTNALATPLP